MCARPSYTIQAKCEAVAVGLRLEHKNPACGRHTPLALLLVTLLLLPCVSCPVHRYEVLAMLQHSNHLEAEYGAGPHTISVPRLRPADGSELSIRPPYEVSTVAGERYAADSVT